jgi:lipopolysaccharide transport system permease protein
LPIQEIEITNARGRVGLSALNELRQYGGVMVAFASRMVRVRYKQAAIGVGWSIVQPVATAAIFTLVLGRISHVSSEGAPYIAFALCGTVLWTFFANSSTVASESLVAEQALLRKIYFPRELLPIAAVLAGCVDIVPAIVVLFTLCVMFGVHASVTWLLVPIPVAMSILSALTFGLLLSSLNVFYRDVRYVLPFVIQFGLFASPVIWSLQQVPQPWRSIYAVANPVAEAIDSMRRVALHSEAPDWGLAALALATSLLMLWCAALLFKRLEHGFADRV